MGLSLIPLSVEDLQRLQNVCSRLESLTVLLKLIPDCREIAAVRDLLEGIEEEGGALCDELEERMAEHAPLTRTDFRA